MWGFNQTLWGMRYPSPKCYMTFWDIIIYIDILHWSNISLNRDLVTERDLITFFDVKYNLIPGGLDRNFAMGAACQQRTLTLPDTWFWFGTCICSNAETIHSWTCHVYGPFEFWISLGTSKKFASLYICLKGLKLIWSNYCTIFNFPTSTFVLIVWRVTFW